MPNLTEDEYGIPDAENPEWTPEMFKGAKRFHELPLGLQRKLKGLPAEGPAVKEVAQIPLEGEVMAALRASGPDWQKRVEDLLREKFVTKAA
jgi:uncharacterized protein (DUF4415 family)